ncbi:MAG: serine/threonine protein phosphatase [Massilia sp.]|nr:serine/threonine protein phosphatase [Massilia sp.]
MHQHYAANLAGRDFVVGDLHGCFTKLQAALDGLSFDADKDRLFSVGDLVDRGQESEQAYEWLSKPWFHPVRGNHEQMAIDCAMGMYDHNCYVSNGGTWFLALTKPERHLIADAFSALPILIDIDTPTGLVGIVHADCPLASWPELAAALEGPHADQFAQMCIWSRERVQVGNETAVGGVHSIIVGHTPMKQSISLGNVRYIDTGAVFGHELTIIQIN